MILIGTMEWASTRLKGMFVCPNCATNQAFRLRASRPFLTLYFIPVLPIGGLSEYVQCMHCRNSFETLVLSNRMLPSDAARTEVSTNTTATFEEDLLNIIALMMVEDGQVTEDEIRIARRLYENITQSNLSREELGRACSHVRMQRWNTLSFLATAAKRRNHDEKLLIVQAMFGVAGADGEITPGRLRSLTEAKNVLQLADSEFQRAVEATTQWLT
jgi:uncharacterized tellurite resistance protein B-like protein